jgi:hypothetical protein
MRVLVLTVKSFAIRYLYIVKIVRLCRAGGYRLVLLSDATRVRGRVHFQASQCKEAS